MNIIEFKEHLRKNYYENQRQREFYSPGAHLSLVTSAGGVTKCIPNREVVTKEKKPKKPETTEGRKNRDFIPLGIGILGGIQMVQLLGMIAILYKTI